MMRILVGLAMTLAFTLLFTSPPEQASASEVVVDRKIRKKIQKKLREYRAIPSIAKYTDERLEILDGILKRDDLRPFEKGHVQLQRARVLDNAGLWEQSLIAYSTALKAKAFNEAEIDAVNRRINFMQNPLVENWELGKARTHQMVKIQTTFPNDYNFDHSGYCEAVIDIDIHGRPENTKIVLCTDPVLEKSSIDTIKKMKYAAYVVNGIPTPQSDVKYRVMYILRDEDGNSVPFPDGFELE